MDIFVIGVMFVEMVSGRHPFYVKSDSPETLNNIRQLDFKMPFMLHPTAMSFVHSTICRQAYRMNIKQTLQHPFVKSRVLIAETSFQRSKKEIMNEPIEATYFNHSSFPKRIPGVHFVGPKWGMPQKKNAEVQVDIKPEPIPVLPPPPPAPVAVQIPWPVVIPQPLPAVVPQPLPVVVPQPLPVPRSRPLQQRLPLRVLPVPNQQQPSANRIRVSKILLFVIRD